MNSVAAGKVTLTLPDRTGRVFRTGITGAEVAAAIGPGLARAAIAVRVNGVLDDLCAPLEHDADLEIVTAGDDSADVLALYRHDAAHVLAQATQELFPGTRITFGPATDTGFYYDFVRDVPFVPDDLVAIEARMREIVARDEPVRKEIWDRDRAISWFRHAGETFKAEWIGEIPRDEPLTIYRQGEWLDLCRGPHLPSTGRLGTAFRLVRVSGAYWRGDSRNRQLQRIHGIAFARQADLDAHLRFLAEVERRDHRKLGREMGLFHQQEEAAGQVFWHPRGWTLWRTLESWLRERLERDGYVEVRTPQLVDRSLWESSGHWDKFRKHMYLAENEEGVLAWAGNGTTRIHALKPMNCPCHVQIFNRRQHAWRDLPLRMAEFGACLRHEPGGALHGIMRVRAFTQDDAHIFCTPEQVESETVRFCRLLEDVYHALGFRDFAMKFADRPPVRAGDEATWDRAEQALGDACRASGISWTANPGEGAFYGPKLEFVLRDAIGREWQCGTLQVDLVLPGRLGAFYTDRDGSRQTPVMLHRAILGSMERFLGILIEQHAGRLPPWLAPVQAVICTVVSGAGDYAATVADSCRKAGLRVETDFSDTKISYKVRKYSLEKTPALVVVGQREAEGGTVSLRRHGGPQQESLPLDEAVARLVAWACPP